jgi:glycine/D-amino acid oxidase-like deaminating enzyme
MRRDLTELGSVVHDVLVIGGGIEGACIAGDVALPGLEVALVERDDFGVALALTHLLSSTRNRHLDPTRRPRVRLRRLRRVGRRAGGRPCQGRPAVQAGAWVPCPGTPGHALALNLVAGSRVAEVAERP